MLDTNGAQSAKRCTCRSSLEMQPRSVLVLVDVDAVGAGMGDVVAVGEAMPM